VTRPVAPPLAALVRPFAPLLAVLARPIAAPLAVLALAVAAAGCGESVNEFREDYNDAVRPLSALGDDVAATLTRADAFSDEQLATRLDGFADRFQQARRNLSRLDPPDDVQDQFDELLGLLKEGIGDLRAVAGAARKGDPAQADEATQALVKTGQRVRQAEAEFKDAVE
jgi:hypothetical protein